MKHFLTFYFIFLMLIQTGSSQNSFIKKYGGNNTGDVGYGTSIIKTSDDAYVFTGNYSENGGPNKIYIYKTDYSGNLIWGKSLGSSVALWAREIIESSDSGYILIGADNNSTRRMFCLKLDRFGDTLWTRYWGTISYDSQGVLKVIQTNDGGFLIVGSAYSSYPFQVSLIIKTNANGDTLWTRHFQGGQYTTFTDAIQDFDSTYFLVGSSKNIGSSICKLHLDTNGQEITNKYFTCAGYDLSYPSFQMTSNGGSIIIGQIYNSGVLDLFQLNDTSNSLIIYHTSFTDIISNLLKTSDGGFIFVSGGSGFSPASFFVKLNSSGDTAWIKAIKEVQFRSVLQDNQGNYLALGNNLDLEPQIITLVKIDSTGSTLCPDTLHYLALSTEIVSTGTANFNFFNSYLYQAYMQLSVSNLSNQFDYCTATGIEEAIRDNELLAANFSQNNLQIDFKSKGYTNLELNVCDINGRNLILKHLNIRPGSNNYSVQYNLAPGIYFVLLSGSEKRYCTKVVKTF